MHYLKSAVVSFFLVASALVGGQAVAAPILITFDAGDPIGGLIPGATLGDQYAASGVTFVANAFTGSGGANGNWATNTTMNIVSATGSEGGTLGTPGLVSGNLLRGLAGWLSENGDPSFAALFSTGIHTFSADFAGVTYASDVRLLAYQGQTLVDSVFGTVSSGQFTLSVSSASLIDRVVIVPGSFADWVGVDNIRFDTLAADVPEPATMAMMVLGLAGLAVARRRQQK
jgi:hypothetical protein